LYSYRTTGEKSLPTLEDIMLKRDKEEIFLVFANSFSSQVVGVVSWRKNCVKMAISGMVTISDEAFVLLLLENNWESWSTNDESTNQTMKRKAIWFKFTSSALGSKWFGGWSKEASYNLINFIQK